MTSTAHPRSSGRTAPGSAPVPHRRSHWALVRRIISPLISIAIIVGVFAYFLPKFTSVSAIWASVRGMSWWQVGVLALAALWNLASYWLVMVATMPGLTYPQAAVVTQSGTAVSNTLPGGGAIGIGLSYAMYSSWGFSRSRSSVSLLVSGVWNNFAKLGMPVLALALLAVQGSPGAGRLAAALAGLAALVGCLALFAMILHSEATARRIGLGAGRVASGLMRLFRRPPVSGWELATVKFRDRTVLLLRARWLWITATTLVSHLSLFLVLLLALRFVGVPESDVSWADVLVVFSFARLLTAIPLTPGGLGVVEVALITGLAASGGDRAQVAAAVLIFRALTYVLPIPLGLGTYLFWRRNHSWRRPPNGAPRTELVPEHV
ncbi:MAG: putative heme transporter [Cryptosporangiaceae bacterium]|nr:putative heme transporter [Cryptosporangiaceae bacterium]